ncbi:MAG: phosphate ABC transporter permease subunit PstC [Candidatus Fermentibacter sp.]|nr:phosphate ABC transporter permease subunit PstC [Candidatus Fermentibacter sp.]
MTRKGIIDEAMRVVLLCAGLASLSIVVLIGLFILRESLPAFHEIGVWNLLSGKEWRPGQGQFGLLPMIAGSGLVTLGAICLGLPLALCCGIFLAEIAPTWFRVVVRPSIELLAGIPSVVYGLFGLVVLVPAVRQIDSPGTAGFGLLSASIVLAVMILPTIASVSEVAIRSVPDEYRQGALALGSTRWEMIRRVVLPAARSGILSAVVLGLGRALGETIAMIMVIGNSVMMPTTMGGPLPGIFLSRARTLTGNIAVEMSYATGLHSSALFATGVVLFVLIMIVNSAARALMSRNVRGGRP